MDLEANKRIVRRIYEQAFNAGDASVFDELYSPAFVHHNKTIHDIEPGPAGEVESMRRFRAAIPDGRFTITLQIAEGDRVANQLVFRGTPTADFPPIRATGDPVEFRSVAIFRIENGQVHEEWFYRAPE